MSRFSVFLIVCLSTLTASCRLFGPDSTEDVSNAFLVPGCGPTDGPALEIYLTQTEYQASCSRLPRVGWYGTPAEEPFTRVFLLGIDSPEEGSFTLHTGSEDGPSYSEGGWAHRCEAGKACVASVAGTVTFGPMDVQGRTPVAVDVQFEDGSRVSNQYVAKTCDWEYICG